MDKKENLLIFGGTGFIGSHLILRFLLKHNLELFCFVDSGSTNSNEYQSGKQQISQAVLKAAEMSNVPTSKISEHLKRVKIIEGKRMDAMLGISENELQSLKKSGIHHIWHADTLYENHLFYKDYIIEYNVVGTQRIVELASFMKVSDFNYVSFGHMDPSSIQDIDSDEFYYENSIQKSEELILSVSKQYPLHVRIFKTSIPIGDSKTCDTLFSSLFYDYIHGVDWFVKWVGDRVKDYFNRFPVRIFKGQKIGINIIPIDYMVDKMISLAAQKNRSPEMHGIQSASIIPIESVYNCVKQSIPGFNYEFVENEEELCLLDKMLHTKLKKYDAYFTGISKKEHFEATDSEIKIHELTEKRLKTFIDKFIAKNNQFEKKHEAFSDGLFNQLEKNEIRCRFGDKITYYTERNSGPTIVFISPSACTYEIWKWLIPNFYKQYNIIISCFRGLDTIITEQTGEPVEFNSQESANDIEEILINESIEKAHVVGYCTSVDEALILNSKKSEMIMSLVLISGEYAVEGNQPPKYTKDLYDIFSMINENPGMAPIFVKTMLQNEVEVSDSDLRDLSLNSYPKHHSKFIRFTQTDEYLVNYCKYVNKKIDEDRLLEIVKNVNRPVLVISSKNDNTIDYKQSIWATENINEAKHYCFNVETHYLIIESPHETSKTMNHFFRGIAKE